MLRTAAGQVANVLRSSMGLSSARTISVSSVRASHGHEESDEAFDKRYVEFFSRENIDGWEIRKGMNDLCGMDLVPDPTIINAAFRACRRVNDLALAIRWMETIKDKCGPKAPELWPYIWQNIQPTITELGIPTIEELGYDKPELALKSIHDM